MKLNWQWSLMGVFTLVLVLWGLQHPAIYAEETPLTVTVTPNSGNFDRPTPITITAEGTCDGTIKIFYTVKTYVTDPNEQSQTLVNDQVYSGPFTVDEPVTITGRAQCEKDGAVLSRASTNEAQVVVGAPLEVTIDPSSGYFDHPTTVTIKTTGTCKGTVIIHYTVKSYYIDDDEKGEPVDTLVDDATYTGPFTVTEPVTVKARAECQVKGVVTATATSDEAQLVVCSPNCYWIAVIGDKGSSNAGVVYQNTKKMVKEIEPWKTLRQKSRKIVVINMATSNQSLDCRELILNGGTFPLCPNMSVIKGATQQGITNNFTSGIHAILVVTNVDCNCGTVENAFSNIVALGTKASTGVIAHEMGHLTGKMVDEYFYKYKYEGGPLGSNCFKTESSCQAATNGVTGAQCELGCRAVNTWRPATQLMHNELDKPYGPLETCIMAKKIMEVIGFYQNNFGTCNFVEPSPLITVPPVPPVGNYYGGGRSTPPPAETSAPAPAPK